MIPLRMVCPNCGGEHFSPAKGYRLAQCLSCWQATDSPGFIPESWRFFDNGGETVDRYSIWEVDGWRGCSADPFHPQGYGEFCGGDDPATFGDDLGTIGEEVTFADLPPKVRHVVLDDALAYLPTDWEDAA